MSLRLLRFVLLLPPLLWSSCAHLGGDVLLIDDDGNDRASVAERWPRASWLELQGPLMQRSLDVVVLVNGLPAIATLDTGATRTAMSSSLAERLGLSELVAGSSDRGRFTDAHGAAGEAIGVVVDSLRLGTTWLERRPVMVFSSTHDFLLIGLDVLQDYEMLIAADQGLVGLFAPGDGPRAFDDVVVPLALRTPSLELAVEARARGASGDAVTFLVVDTGAMGTSFPSAPGVLAGVAADLRFTSTTIGVASSKEERGRFRLDPLRLGPGGVDVGAVAAWEAIHNDGQGPGLLGVDVLARFRTLIVPRAPSELRLQPLPKRPSSRDRGPDGYACPGGCVSVAVVARTPEASLADLHDGVRGAIERLADEQMGLAPSSSSSSSSSALWALGGRTDGACLRVDIHGVWGGHKVELAITDASDRPGGALAGSAITLVVDVPQDRGFHECVPLPASTEALGVGPGTPLSLRFVRSDRAISAGCPQHSCLYWSGA